MNQFHISLKKLVVLTGSGISAESGLKTFREMGGLWEEYDVHEVASPAGWEKDMDLVLRFYNERRKQLLESEPNPGHRALAELEEFFDVEIITQNVDDLHERAGSKKILHIHGEIRKAQCIEEPHLVYEIDGWELKRGDTCENGHQLRPHVVWFGEAVTKMQTAIALTRQADIFAVIGTSLVVYPAAGLLDYVPRDVPVYLVDPGEMNIPRYHNIEFIREKAGVGVPLLKKHLLENFI